METEDRSNVGREDESRLEHDKRHRHQRQPNRREPHPLTSAQQLEYIRRCVKWTLWNIATGEPIKDEPTAAQKQAQALFQDPAWVSKVVGSFAANIIEPSLKRSIDFSAFLGLDSAQERRER